MKDSSSGVLRAIAFLLGLFWRGAPWFAIALLSLSWLPALGYYHHPNWFAWGVAVFLSAIFLLGAHPLAIRKPIAFSSVALLLPAWWPTEWPISAIPAMLLVGVLLCIAPFPRRWPGAIGSALVTTGIILLAQAVAIFGYQSITGRSHELPLVLADLLSAIARLLGIDAAGDGNTVALHTMRKLHELGATWDLFLDPATFCFLVGGVAFLGLRASALPAEHRWKTFSKAAAALALCMLAWLPIRAGLSMSLLIHRALRTEFDSPLILMDQFRNGWVFLALLLAPAALAARFVSIVVPAALPATAPTRIPAELPRWRRFAAAGAALAAVFTVTFAALWDPTGTLKPAPGKRARVIIDESHSKWEPTQRAFDTTWYGHDSGYNYYCIYDYLNHFYDTSRNEAHVTDATLANCDVFISKVPTSRYDTDEVDAIERFVRAGGGLMLIGEHTDVFGTGVSLNDIASRFGFSFRYDVILDTDTSFEQALRPHWAPHPATGRVSDFDFAVTCSIDPGASFGRAAVLSRSLRSLGPDYHASNFYPPIDDATDERYGAFVQAWATRAGHGRVFAWADSTVWSNFCTFEPGKIEMLEGIVAWLNHRDGALDPRGIVWTLAVLCISATIVLGRGWKGSWLVMLSAGFLGWAITGPLLRHLSSPDLDGWPAQHAPFHRLVIDRTVCATPLSRGGFIDGKPDGFGVFERWILRLGYFFKRASGDDALKDDLIVFTYPSKDVPADFRAALVRYVRDGGKVLVIDSPENTTSTANSLLYPFHLEMKHRPEQALPAGDLSVPVGWTSTHVAAACEIAGGDPLIRLDGKPVASTVRFGKGAVTALGFGSRFTDPSMGVTGDTIPDEDLLKTYALDYALLPWLVEGRQPPATQPATTTTAPTTEQIKQAIMAFESGNLGAGPGK